MLPSLRNPASLQSRSGRPEQSVRALQKTCRAARVNQNFITFTVMRQLSFVSDRMAASWVAGSIASVDRRSTRECVSPQACSLHSHLNMLNLDSADLCHLKSSSFVRFCGGEDFPSDLTLTANLEQHWHCGSTEYTARGDLTPSDHKSRTSAWFYLAEVFYLTGRKASTTTTLLGTREAVRDWRLFLCSC